MKGEKKRKRERSEEMSKKTSLSISHYKQIFRTRAIGLTSRARKCGEVRWLKKRGRERERNGARLEFETSHFPRFVETTSKYN